MQIQLKQREIEQALKQYLENKGFDLNGKSVQTTFSTVRKPANEVIADVVIEDAHIPGFTDTPVKPTADAPKAPVVALVPPTAPEAPNEAPKASEEAQAQAPAAAPTPSLFGGS